jgi:hypothetical protein
VAVAFLLVASCFRLPAGHVPGRDRLGQARHRAAAAAAAGAVAAEAADHKGPAFSLVGLVLHPLALPQPGADVIRQVDLREVGPVERRPSVPACRTVSVDPGPVADFVQAHFAVDLAPHRAVAAADDAAPAVATAHSPKPTAVSLFLLLLAHLPHRALAIARRPGLGLCRALEARARGLHAAPMAGLSARDELVRPVYLLQPGKAACVLRLPRGLPLLQFVAARRACLFHVQLVAATRLTRGPASLPALRDRLCRVRQTYPPARAPRPLDLQVPGCLPHARQHELAVEHSLDFRF